MWNHLVLQPDILVWGNIWYPPYLARFLKSSFSGSSSACHISPSFRPRSPNPILGSSFWGKRVTPQNHHRRNSTCSLVRISWLKRAKGGMAPGRFMDRGLFMFMGARWKMDSWFLPIVTVMKQYLEGSCGGSCGLHLGLADSIPIPWKRNYAPHLFIKVNSTGQHLISCNSIFSAFD